MKKLLLSLATVCFALTSFAQSLTLVATDHEGTFETPAVDNTLSGTYKFNGIADICTYYFFVKNNSSQAGTVSVISLTSSNDYAATHTPTPGLCYNNSCYSVGNFPDFEIEANGEYRGGTDMSTGQPITKGSGMDLQLIYLGATEEGTGEYRLEFKFEHDEASSVFFVNIDFTNGGSIADASVLGNLKVYQDESGNIVADYGFGNAGDRALSIVSISGQKVFECPVDDASGNMTLPVQLNKGVYLYSVTEGGKILSTHKFVVK